MKLSVPKPSALGAAVVAGVLGAGIATAVVVPLVTDDAASTVHSRTVGDTTTVTSPTPAPTATTATTATTTTTAIPTTAPATTSTPLDSRVATVETEASANSDRLGRVESRVSAVEGQVAKMSTASPTPPQPAAPILGGPGDVPNLPQAPGLPGLAPQPDRNVDTGTVLTGPGN